MILGVDYSMVWYNDWRGDYYANRSISKKKCRRKVLGQS